MHDKMKDLPTPETDRLLLDTEQQQLMLQFHLEQDFIALQSHTYFSTEGPGRSWKNLDKLSKDEFCAIFPKVRSNVILVLKDTKMPQAITLQHRLNNDVLPNTMDFLIELTTQTPFNQWCDQNLQKKFATPVSCSKLTRQV